MNRTAPPTPHRPDCPGQAVIYTCLYSRPATTVTGHLHDYARAHGLHVVTVHTDHTIDRPPSSRPGWREVVHLAEHDGLQHIITPSLKQVAIQQRWANELRVWLTEHRIHLHSLDEAPHAPGIRHSARTVPPPQAVPTVHPQGRSVDGIG